MNALKDYSVAISPAKKPLKTLMFANSSSKTLIAYKLAIRTKSASLEQLV
jgi:hypothetical protein